MRSLLVLPLSLLLPFFQATVNAVIVPFVVRTSNTVSTSLTRRSPVSIGNTGNAQYVSNITLGGTTVQVLLDTGRWLFHVINFASLATYLQLALIYGCISHLRHQALQKIWENKLHYHMRSGRREVRVLVCRTPTKIFKKVSTRQCAIHQDPIWYLHSWRPGFLCVFIAGCIPGFFFLTMN